MPTLLDKRNDCFAKIAESTSSPVLYDLGCGQKPEEGFIGLDFHAEAEGVQNVDLYSYPWPIADASVDYFRSSHFLEHVPDWDAHFTEIYRCLKPNGYYEIIAPYYMSRRFFQDPDHKQPILQERFLYLFRPWRKLNRIEHYGAQVNMEMIGWFESLHDDFADQGYSDEALQFHRLHSFNVIEDVALVLKKLEIDEE